MAIAAKRRGNVISVSKREKVSAVDTAWLRMDRPANLMMICGVLMLDRPLSLARLRRIVAERFLVFRRFRQRTVRTAAGAWWRDDPGFDLTAHVVAVKLAGDAGDVELQALVSKLVATPLSHERPMWQFHLVTNYRGGAALGAGASRQAAGRWRLARDHDLSGPWRKAVLALARCRYRAGRCDACRSHQRHD